MRRTLALILVVFLLGILTAHLGTPCYVHTLATM